MSRARNSPTPSNHFKKPSIHSELMTIINNSLYIISTLYFTANQCHRKYYKNLFLALCVYVCVCTILCMCMYMHVYCVSHAITSGDPLCMFCSSGLMPVSMITGCMYMYVCVYVCVYVCMYVCTS